MREESQFSGALLVSAKTRIVRRRRGPLHPMLIAIVNFRMLRLKVGLPGVAKGAFRSTALGYVRRNGARPSSFDVRRGSLSSCTPSSLSILFFSLYIIFFWRSFRGWC